MGFRYKNCKYRAGYISQAGSHQGVWKVMSSMIFAPLPSAIILWWCRHDDRKNGRLVPSSTNRNTASLSSSSVIRLSHVCLKKTKFSCKETTSLVLQPSKRRSFTLGNGGLSARNSFSVNPSFTFCTPCSTGHSIFRRIHCKVSKVIDCLVDGANFMCGSNFGCRNPPDGNCIILFSTSEEFCNRLLSRLTLWDKAAVRFHRYFLFYYRPLPEIHTTEPRKILCL